MSVIQLSKTEMQLSTVYGPTVALAEVCKIYFNLSPTEAGKRAARNELPVPTFQLTDSQKAPRLIKVEDLAAYIDRSHETALKEWVKSQV